MIGTHFACSHALPLPCKTERADLAFGPVVRVRAARKRAAGDENGRRERIQQEEPGGREQDGFTDTTTTQMVRDGHRMYTDRKQEEGRRIEKQLKSSNLEHGNS